MRDLKYLNRLFRDYYKEKKANLPLVKSFNQREFGFIPWEKQVRMIRHMGFTGRENLMKYLFSNGPRHVYSSGALYLNPENQDMKGKGYQGCDLIIDIDVDHFYTPCKDDHDLWYCKECGKNGIGMVEKCPKCGKLKLKTLNWICEECLNIAKNEIFKLIYEFLIPDFGIQADQMKITFSGHRGYHLKVENEKIRTLTSNERREIIDYITGENISFEILGLREKQDTIFGFSKENIGWSQKILEKLEDILTKPDQDIENLLMDKRKFNFSSDMIRSFINYKNDFLNVLSNNQNNVWTIEGFGLPRWNKLLRGIVDEIGVEVDIPVAIDIHRLIRYPSSLHGKTGFKVQEIFLDELDDFNPLDEVNDKLDPIVFKSKVQTTQKLEIIEEKVPVTKIKGEKYGPYSKGQKDEVPHHIAVFLLCKEVARTI